MMRHHAMLILINLLLISIAGVFSCSSPPHTPGTLTAVTETPDKPYASDGCTLVPDHDFFSCCEQHDRTYWCGGTREQRKRADRQLKACIRERGHQYLSGLYYAGVRLGGSPWLPTYWRWGFGWSGQYRYTHYARVCEHH